MKLALLLALAPFVLVLLTVRSLGPEAAQFLIVAGGAAAIGAVLTYYWMEERRHQEYLERWERRADRAERLLRRQ